MKRPVSIRALTLTLALAITAVIGAGSIFTEPSISWGPVTHMSVSIEAGQDSGYPVSDDLLGAYLAGTTEPDIGLDDGMSEDYGAYHSVEFAEAMERVADTMKSPGRELLRARALGMRSHIAADGAAHGKTGYANTKVMYESVDFGLPSHATTELCGDMLIYREKRDTFRKVRLDFIDPETLAAVREEYARSTGSELKSDPAALKKEVLSHKAMVLTELALAEHLATRDTAKLDQMAVPYADMRQGYKGGPGFDAAVASVKEKVAGSDELKGFDNRNLGAKLKELTIETLPGKGLQAIEKGMLNLMRLSPVRKKASEVAGPRVSGNDRNRAFLHFGLNLLDPGLTFEQAVCKAGATAFGIPESPEVKLAFLRIEASVIRNNADRAKEKYQNRPFWKFWLYLTNSDRRKWEALEAEHAARLAEIAALEESIGAAGQSAGPVAEAGASPAAANELAKAGSGSDAGDDGAGVVSLQGLKTQVDAAAARLTEALQSGSADAVEGARVALDEARQRLARASSGALK